ncbi:cytochrome P450 [Streptomyces sulfonofaciens]|uniref:Cytochrome P450 n=1 Tax=Streptomyces sulfonofaciens TaxID=68272 RepID=A0A919FZS2_9ACTN|nr:cytochrome P450 [Streptomyces sulfonofaciens]GHH75458.1 cytochrome P450 [Streptomyces sulfonofaciens]
MTDSPSRPGPAAAAPPPGCPAHASAGGTGPGGLYRLHGPEAQGDLAGLYEKLRTEHGSVAPVLLHNDVPVWAVLGHTENLHMVRTASHFTRDTRQWRAVQDGTAGPDHPLAPVFTWQPMCSFAEGAEHQRLRGAVTSAMASIDHRGVRRYIHRYSQRLVNDFCEAGTADLVSQFAEHLPMMVMCQILGMPEEYDERLVQAARDMIKGTETAIESNEYVMAALHRLVARRRSEPGDDFTGALITHESRLTDDEVAQHLRLVLIASYEATANLIANVLRVVMTDPRFRAQLNGGQMTVPEAVEQSLWDEPPFSAILTYVAKQDTELGGQQIRAGDGLMLGIAPGNADPVVRPEPGAHMQGNRSHLAFSGGPHECPGQDIGRAVADTGVDALLTRLPDVRLAVPEEELDWTSSILSRHLVALPVRFEPKPPQDIMRRPSAATAARRDTDWQVTSPGPADGTGPGTADAAPAGPPAPATAAASAPTAHSAVAVAEAPARAGTAARVGLWRRLLLWWRGD